MTPDERLIKTAPEKRQMNIGNSYCINIDSSRCTSLVEGGAFVGKEKYRKST